MIELSSDAPPSPGAVSTTTHTISDVVVVGSGGGGSSMDSIGVDGVQRGGIKIVSLNCWGLPDRFTYPTQPGVERTGVLPPNRVERMRNIAARVGEWDIVTFQELWVPWDRPVIIEAAREQGLVHSHYWRSNLVGSGLLIVSRYPIIDTDFYKYRLCGKPQRHRHGDWEAGKGIGLARVQVDANTVFDIYTTHTIAQYGNPDEYFGHRVLEILEVVDFVRNTNKSPLLIITGDFNCVRDRVEYRLLMSMLKLNDSYLVVSPFDTETVTHVFNPYVLDYVLYRKRIERLPEDHDDDESVTSALIQKARYVLGLGRNRAIVPQAVDDHDYDQHYEWVPTEAYMCYYLPSLEEEQRQYLATRKHFRPDETVLFHGEEVLPESPAVQQARLKLIYSDHKGVAVTFTKRARHAADAAQPLGHAVDGGGGGGGATTRTVSPPPTTVPSVPAVSTTADGSIVIHANPFGEPEDDEDDEDAHHDEHEDSLTDIECAAAEELDAADTERKHFVALLRSTIEQLQENVAWVKRRRNVHLAWGVGWAVVAAIILFTPFARWTFYVLPSIFVLLSCIRLGYVLFFKHGEVWWIEHTITRLRKELEAHLSESEQAAIMRQREQRQRRKFRKVKAKVANTKP